MAVTNILRWCPPAQGLVGPEGVVEFLPGQEGRPNRGQLQVAIVALPELLYVGPMGPLHLAIELGATGRQHKQTEASLLAGLLKLGHEFTAAVHPSLRSGQALDGPEGERKAGP